MDAALIGTNKKPMRYLITGGAGFIGSHLAEALLRRGDSILVLDNLSTGSFDNIRHLESHPDFAFEQGNVGDVHFVNACAKKVDRVFHLASAVGVKLIIDKPIETIETIVQGASVMLKLCAKYRLPILITSTSEVYGKSRRLPFSEKDDSLIGAPEYRRWAYASAKALGEFLALAHWHESRLPVVVVRLFNTVGPRQSGQYGMVMPRLIAQALSGKPLSIYGNGTQSRCFCHVSDAVRALIGLLDEPRSAGELFNVGSTESVSINQLAQSILSLTGSPSSIEHIPYARAYGEGFEDMRSRVPSIEKIQKLIGYKPKHNLISIIRDIIPSFKSI